MMRKMKIGFIGTGVMGKSMVKHLMNAGHELYIYTRTKAKAEDLINLGAIWKETFSEIASTCEVIFTFCMYIVNQCSSTVSPYFFLLKIYLTLAITPL